MPHHPVLSDAADRAATALRRAEADRDALTDDPAGRSAAGAVADALRRVIAEAEGPATTDDA